ncbi:glycosyltransferase family 2 protein [Terrabacter sp. BE26]|uniref:glycosyltransferase family 2 protein n=1 Tax=Terrabacter sp. BE26 TaxID=2898152 RepID=UPI0035BE7622
MSARATVVVVGFGSEEYLEQCLSAIAVDMGPSDELILVDNGVAGAAHRRNGWPPQVRTLCPGRNLGFAGGVNLGAEAGNGIFVILVNSDAIIEPGAIDALISVADEARPTMATGCLRLANAPDRVNSAGNPLHYTGLCWAGGHGELATSHSLQRQVATATGGLMALRRAVWDRLEGFNESYFAYHEDCELSVRMWLVGGQVVFTPHAVALHHYNFSRNALKMYLLERNRLATVLTVYPTSLRRRVLPAILLSEVGLLALATKQGWLTQKIEGYRWLWRHRRDLRIRRELVTRTWQREPAALTPLLSVRIDPAMMQLPPLMWAVNFLLDRYWRLLGGGARARG